MDASDAERLIEFMRTSNPEGLAAMKRQWLRHLHHSEAQDEDGATFEASGSSAQSDGAPHRDEMVRRVDEILEEGMTVRFSGGGSGATPSQEDEVAQARNFFDEQHEKDTRNLARAHVDYLKQKLHAGNITNYALKRETIVAAECVMCCPFTNAERNEHDCSCGLMQRIAFFANPEDEALNKEWQECHKGQHAQIANLLLQSTVCRCAYYVGFPTRAPIEVLAELEPHPVRCQPIRSIATSPPDAPRSHHAHPHAPHASSSSCPGCALRERTRRE